MSDGDRPAPLVPVEVDLRGLPGFMLDVNRLLASELVALGTDAECWAALMLWCRAWHQVPAASMPGDDRVLAAFAGVSLAKWRRIRDMAMRGFVLCSDGRYYHQVLSQEALQAWAKRVAYRERRARDTERMQRWRKERDGDGDEPVTRHREPDAPAPTGASRDAPVTPAVTHHGSVTDASRTPLHGPSRDAPGDAPPLTLPPSETGTGTERSSDPKRARVRDASSMPTGRPPQRPATPETVSGATTADSPADSRAAAGTAIEPWAGLPLHSKVFHAFAQQSPDGGLTWASQPSQHGAVDRLVVRASRDEDPEEWLRRYLETAWWLREQGRDVWRGQPWVPAVICSPKMMPRVVEAMAARAAEALDEVPAELLALWGKR